MTLSPTARTVAMFVQLALPTVDVEQPVFVAESHNLVSEKKTQTGHVSESLLWFTTNNNPLRNVSNQQQQRGNWRILRDKAIFCSETERKSSTNITSKLKTPVFKL